MAGDNGPNKTGPGQSGGIRGEAGSDQELEQRKRKLEAALATRRVTVDEDAGPKSGGMAGFGNALRLSSEFIAGIAVGAGLGWLIDRFAGTSPFGLIVFLLLGFVAGVLNVLRSAGVVAESKLGKGPSDHGQADR